jgi:hypothetical protein
MSSRQLLRVVVGFGIGLANADTHCMTVFDAA